MGAFKRLQPQFSGVLEIEKKKQDTIKKDKAAVIIQTLKQWVTFARCFIVKNKQMFQCDVYFDRLQSPLPCKR